MIKQYYEQKMDIQKILPKTGKYIKEIEESGSEKILSEKLDLL